MAVAAISLALVSAALAASVAGVWVPGWATTFRRWRALRDAPTPVQWSQALLFLAGAMRAGATIDDALRLLSARAAPALRRRIEASGWDRALSPRTRVERLLAGDEIAFARAAMLMFLESGGRIGRVLETAAATLQAKGEAGERVAALTAQARASAWVVGLSPFALGGAMSLLSPATMSPLLTTSAGRVLAVAAAGMSLTGLFFAMRLAKVDV